MNKRIFLLVAVITIAVISITVYDVLNVSKEEYAELIKNHPFQKRKALSKKERKRMGIPPNRYFDDQYLLEMNPKTGKTSPENLLEIRKKKSTSQRFYSVPGQNSEMAWEERGPNNIGGRTRVVFYDPNDTSGKRVFAGGVTGGLWVNNNIENENSTWTQVGIDENLSISCYAIDPNDSNIWYVGTGEAYTLDDGVGNGLWKTTNGGNTWVKIINTDLSISEENRFYFINQILAWDNGGTTEVFFSVDGQFDIDPVGFNATGWWKLNNNGANRINFLAPQGSPYVFSDIEIAVDNSIWVGTKRNLFGHGGGKIFRSTDGINFTEKYSFLNGIRVELAISKQDPNTVYGLASTGNSDNVELVKTIDGSNFSSIAKPNDVDEDIPANDFAREQGFYNLTLEVDPINDQILYAGGLDLFRSTNSGSSWTQISKWSNNNSLVNLNVSLVHPDQHAVTFNPKNHNQGLFANDGGIYYCADLEKSASNEQSIESRNKGYNITQFYSGAIGQDKNNELLLGGTQDNGSLLSTVSSGGSIFAKANVGVNSFSQVFTGDGIQNFIDKDNEYIIVSFVNNFYSALSLNNSFAETIIAEDTNTGSFANVADLDDNLDILYTDGTTVNGVERISRYTDLLGSPQRRNFSDSKLFENPTAIKVSPFTLNSSTVFVGTEGASILKVTNLNTNTPTWENIDLNSDINIGAISDIDFGKNENEILVTLHNYGVQNIYYTTNGGATWSEKEGDFPDIPVKAIKMNPFDENEVIIGTNAGVWRTANFTSSTPNWVQSQNGMSDVKITKFDMRTSDNTVLAATYGRGLFTGKFQRTTSTLDEDADLEEKIDLNFGSLEKNRLEFKIEEVESPIKIVVFDMKGSVVLKKTLNPQEGNTQGVNITFQSGIYIVNVSAGGKAYSKKIRILN